MEKNAIPYPRPERLKYYYDLYRKFNSHMKLMAGNLTSTDTAIISELVNELVDKRAGEVRQRDLKVLDYGAGKGMQYLKQRSHEAWGGSLPHCYDPCVPHLNDRPCQRFDAVICTDVMEHLEEDDVDDVLVDIVNLLEPDVPTFAYIHTCCRRSHKQLDDGRSVHLTVQPMDWWEVRIKRAFIVRPLCHLYTSYER